MNNHKYRVIILPTAGAFNPNVEDPMPGQMKKQLVLKVISGQQLPKPKDSMLGDRGEVGPQTRFIGLSFHVELNECEINL